MSEGAYAPDKALAHPDRLKILRAGGQPYPVHIHLIPSDLCAPLACPGCAYRLDGYTSNQLFKIVESDGRVNNNPNRMLSFDLIKSILDDCETMGVKACEITGGGEPTLHPNILEILQYARTRKMDTALITHGLLIKKKPGLVDEAARCLWARVSIDAATEKTYGVVRPSFGGPHGENLHVALGAVTALREARDRDKTECVIGAGFVVQKENWSELYDACRLYRDAGADNIRVSGLFTPEKDSYHVAHRDAASEMERRAIADFSKDGFTVHGRFCEKLDDLAHAPSDPRCGYMNFTLYVAGDQNVYTCCNLAYNLRGKIGSIVEAGGFKRLLDSHAKREFFSTFDARECSMCQFSDRIRAINAAVDGSAVPATSPLHANFV